MDTSISPPRPGLWRVFVAAGLVAFAIAAAVAAFFIYRITTPPLSVAMTRQFTESIPTIGPSDGILETATASIPETFTQSDSASLFNIPLGTTVSEIRVPAVYRYHVSLFDPWKIEVRGQVCIVTAPMFEPSFPPAIVTGQMEKSTSAGWLRFDAANSLDSLEKGITEELSHRASDETHRNFVREACRQSVAEFVKAWLMKENYWRADRFHQVVIVFPDDPPMFSQRTVEPNSPERN